MRIVKEYDERKKELVDAAEQLFLEAGYEQTAVSTIIDKVGVSKGTFYYYFKSKEDLLDCLAERAARQSMLQVEALVGEEGLDALAKINRVYEASRQWQKSNVELVMTILSVMHKDENLLLRHKIEQRSLDLCIPVFAKIVQQGVEEGVFRVNACEEVAELILRIGNNLSEITVPLFLQAEQDLKYLERVKHWLTLYEQAVERVLGIPEGSIHILDQEFLDAFAERYFSGKRPRSAGEVPAEPVDPSGGAVNFSPGGAV